MPPGPPGPEGPEGPEGPYLEPSNEVLPAAAGFLPQHQAAHGCHSWGPVVSHCCTRQPGLGFLLPKHTVLVQDKKRGTVFRGTVFKSNEIFLLYFKARGGRFYIKSNFLEEFWHKSSRRPKIWQESLRKTIWHKSSRKKRNYNKNIPFSIKNDPQALRA